ncbi:TPA: hypothetical protein QCY29_004111 [Bacillus toyonensis]|nr:hypothetical protein [Bacillus toyonensis]
MIAIFLGVIAIANGLLLLALKVVRVIVAKGSNSMRYFLSRYLPVKAFTLFTLLFNK